MNSGSGFFIFFPKLYRELEIFRVDVAVRTTGHHILKEELSMTLNVAVPRDGDFGGAPSMVRGLESGERSRLPLKSVLARRPVSRSLPSGAGERAPAPMLA